MHSHRQHGIFLLILVLSLAGSSPGLRAEAPNWLAGDLPDYAPSGMPDFSQCRGEWSLPGSPPQWTHAAPVALADLLWWLDSAAERDPLPPPGVRDTHPLVSAYPVFGPARDDHEVANLYPLVLDLAGRLGTNDGALRGTRWSEVIPAIQSYVESRGIAGLYSLEQQDAPDGHWLNQQVARSAGILLLLGLWEMQDEEWLRVGGHYASLAGSTSEAVYLADPLADEAGRTGRGRARPEDPALHSCREAPSAHDDAARVSHDRYRLSPEPVLPGGRLVLEDYFAADRLGEAAAFSGQNPAGPAPDAAWLGGPVVMAVDAAAALLPDPILLPRSSPSPEPSPPASPTPSPEPSRPATSSPTPTPTGTAGSTSPTPGPEPTASPTTWPTDVASRCWLPSLRR